MNKHGPKTSAVQIVFFHFESNQIVIVVSKVTSSK